MKEKIKIAEQRIEEAQERADYFKEMYKQTGKIMYAEMREEELKLMDKIVEAIIKVKKEQAGI